MAAAKLEESTFCRAFCGGCCAVMCATGAQQYFQTKMWGSESSSRTAGCFPRRWHDGSKEEAFDRAERLDLEKLERTTTEQPREKEGMKVSVEEKEGGGDGDGYEDGKDGEGERERDNPVAREGDGEGERKSEEGDAVVAEKSVKV